MKVFTPRFTTSARKRPAYQKLAASVAMKIGSGMSGMSALPLYLSRTFV